LQDEAKKQELFEAVASDARKIGALKADILAMPCMSMIGFHDGVEKALGRHIIRLSDALAEKYKDVEQVGVIHMRPAKKRIEEIFGGKAVTPDERQAEALLKAEEKAKADGNPFAVYEAMKEIVEAWRDRGITHILFARADAPKAHLSSAGMVEQMNINNYFDILAEATLKRAKEMQKRV
jgi:aspartate/glutamate racemase